MNHTRIELFAESVGYDCYGMMSYKLILQAAKKNSTHNEETL